MTTDEGTSKVGGRRTEFIVIDSMLQKREPQVLSAATD